MSKARHTAQPGDIFLLLVPIGNDLKRLRGEQLSWQVRYGGHPVEPIHITVERFTPTNDQLPQDCVRTLHKRIFEIESFPIEADGIIQFFAPYWQSYVLRWRVHASPAWIDFRERLKVALEQINCPSHFTRRRHATCTILILEDKIDLPQEKNHLSMPLFTAWDLRISTLNEDGQFEILETLKLSG